MNVSKPMKFVLSATLGSLLLATAACAPKQATPPAAQVAAPFQLMEATVESVHAAFKSGQLTSHQLVQMYLDRIEAYDKQGPTINSIITLNKNALAEADALDAAYKASGPVGSLHGIPVLLKDQFDAAGFPTTLGSVLLKDYRPARGAVVSEKLKAAGAIILGKVTLGELGGGDSYGSLFGVTRNPYDLERTAGGSSGGTGASVAANFSTIGVGEEGFSSIRRPSAWNNLVGMRPTAGLVSRSGMWDGWPGMNGSLGPMTRTVEDLAKLLDVMVGYDAEDPLTAYGVGHIPSSYTKFLDKDGLKGARIGVIRESIIGNSEPASEDFKQVDAAYAKAIAELQAAGAVIVDNIVIPDIKALLGKRASAPDADDSQAVYFGRNAAEAPFKNHAEMFTPANVAKVSPTKHLERSEGRKVSAAEARNTHYESLLARKQLMSNLLKVMADNQLDVIVHKTVEHQAGNIKAATSPPYPGTRGVIHINTFLEFVSSMTVPAGFTADGMPTGITFLGREYDEPTLIKLAYSYEQATHHRKPPASTPAL
jgi:Asp-tRNA(Asn)/Glu-tRNA(Gln) amidotransferase A subunit family amidase